MELHHHGGDHRNNNDNSTSSSELIRDASADANNASVSNVLLRVKRRRTDPPPSCLVLVQPVRVNNHYNNNDNDKYRSEAKRKTRENDAPDLATTTTTAETTTTYLSPWNTNSVISNQRLNDHDKASSSSLVTTTIWKRRDGDGNYRELEDGDQHSNSRWDEHPLSDHSMQIVDAVLEDDTVTPLGARSTSISWRDPKRRRLTLIDPTSVTAAATTTTATLPTTTTSSASRGSGGRRRRRNHDGSSKNSVPFYPVLDPLSRLVDDSLRAVHVGDVPTWQHWQLLTTDARLLHPDGTPDTRWFTWNQSTGGGGNLLHACALWNDVDMLTEIIQASVQHYYDGNDGDESLQHDPTATSSSLSWLRIMLQAVNGDGWTPQQVAQLAGHENIVQILDNIMGGGSAAAAASMENDEDFVYDEYWLYQDTNNSHPSDEEVPLVDPNHMTTQDMLTVELQGGYWENGELIFAPNEGRDEECADEHHDEDDEDSNSEGYAGNDYPEENYYYYDRNNNNDDEEEEDDDWIGQDDVDGPAVASTEDLRRRHVPPQQLDVGSSDHHHHPPATPWFSAYAREEPDEEYEHDAAWYGLVDDHDENGDRSRGTRRFAYDPQLDHEDDDEEVVEDEEAL